MKFLRHKVAGVFLWFKEHWKLTAFVLLVVVLGAGWYLRQAEANKPVLTFEAPKRETIIKTLDVSGIVDAKEKARLRFLAGGKITYLGAQPGNLVKKGQTLATIDQATLKKQLEQDLNTFMQERLDWDQLNDDVYQDVFTKREDRQRQQGQLDLTNEVLDVEIRDIAIANTRLTAPFAGILTTSPTTTTGVQLMSTDYFEVVNPDTLLFKAEVDEADIALIKMNQKATLTLDAHPDETITSYVNYISYTSSQTSNGTVFLIELPLDSTRYGIDFFRLGMNGDVAIELERKDNALAIPLVALKERDGKAFVDVKTGDQGFTEREVTTGLETDEKVEIVSGLTEQDQVLIPES
jgi:membrane fusion protein, macrolide-specific efflux system